jgi:hypothetical protein
MSLEQSKLVELEAEHALVERECGRGAGGGGTNLRALIAQGWRATYAELFGQSFVDVLDSAETDDCHHSEAIQWHWDARIALLTGSIPPNNHYAYFPIWARGNLKSSLAETMVVVDAVLSVAYNQKGYCLYIGREKDRVKENIGNIETLLSCRKIKEYAPQLSEVAKNDETNSKRQWTGTFLHTSAGYIIKGGTVESSQAGSRIKHLGDDTTRDTRVTLFVPDDIDSREDSPVIADNRFRLLTTEILPMKQENTLTFFAQNLISRHSVMYRIQNGGARVLTNRKPTMPIPAVRNLVTEQRTINGIVKDVVLSGQPTWRAWSLTRVQNEIDTMGLPAFLREMQHEVEHSRERLVHKNYDDNVHPISFSQLASVFGSPDSWKNWYKVPFSDWSRTKTKYHSNVAGYLMVSSQNTRLPGLTFLLPLSFKAGAAPEDVAARLLSVLTPFAYQDKTWTDLIDESWKRMNAEQHFGNVADRLDFVRGHYKAVIPNYSRRILNEYHVKTGANSHSEDKIRELFNDGFGFNFVPSNPPNNSGAIEKIDTAMRVDYDENHLFKPNKKGYTRWYVLCPDDTSAEPETVNGMQVYPPVPYPDVMQPDDLHDSDLFRYQMLNRQFADSKLTELGERVDTLLKLNDDFGQGLEMVYYLDLLSNIELTFAEVVEAQMPEHLSKENISQYYGQRGFPELVMARMAQENQIKIQIEEERKAQDDLLRNTFVGGGGRIRLFGRRRR